MFHEKEKNALRKGEVESSSLCYETQSGLGSSPLYDEAQCGVGSSSSCDEEQRGFVHFIIGFDVMREGGSRNVVSHAKDWHALVKAAVELLCRPAVVATRCQSIDELMR